MKDLNPAKEESFNCLIQFLDTNGYLEWFHHHFPEAENEKAKGFWIWHNGAMTLKVDEPQNMSAFVGSPFKLLAERQEKYYTYFFRFEPETEVVTCSQ